MNHKDCELERENAALKSRIATLTAQLARATAPQPEDLAEEKRRMDASAKSGHLPNLEG